MLLRLRQSYKLEDGSRDSLPKNFIWNKFPEKRSNVTHFRFENTIEVQRAKLKCQFFREICSKFVKSVSTFPQNLSLGFVELSLKPFGSGSNLLLLNCH